MSTERPEKLKKVLKAVPAGYLVDAAWLTSQGIAYETFRDYVKRGWLDRVHRGVFRRPTPNPTPENALDWKTSLLSLQHIMGYKLHVGGSTALSLYGHSHYLRLGSNTPLWVYGNNIPNWLPKLPLNATLQTRALSLFKEPDLDLQSQDNSPDRTPSAALPWDWTLTMSTPERAILEALDELPDHESFHSLDMVFEGLANLRPGRIAALLKSCKKIKVTRLFFVFADRHDHAWRKRLDPKEFNLGKGDRALVKGGKIHPRYRIVIPEEFVNRDTGDGP